MKIVCPNCELKGQVDAAPTGARTRIVCVRCGTTCDADYEEGQMQPVLAQAVTEDSLNEVVHDGSEANLLEANSQLYAAIPAQAGEVAAEAQLISEQTDAASPVANNVLAVSTTELLSDEVSATSPGVESEEFLAALTQPRLRTESPEMDARGEDDSAATAEVLKSQSALKVNRAPSDPYSVGVRLMRVSPVWLLLAGLSLISFIVLCNWLIKPAEQASEIDRAAPATTTAAAAVVNNQSASQSPSITEVEMTTGAPLAAQPPATREVAYIATEAKADAHTTVAPPVNAPLNDPIKESLPLASRPNSVSESAEGKMTVQVGSYNESGQAEARVVELKAAGCAARVVPVDLPGRGTWYRVQSGRFLKRAEAEQYGKGLREKGVVSSFITTEVQ